MTDLLEKAIAEIRKLPTDQQEDVASAILSLIGDGGSRLSPAQQAEVQMSMSARQFLSEEEIEALYDRYAAPRPTPPCRV